MKIIIKSSVQPIRIGVERYIVYHGNLYDVNMPDGHRRVVDGLRFQDTSVFHTDRIYDDKYVMALIKINKHYNNSTNE